MVKKIQPLIVALFIACISLHAFGQAGGEDRTGTPIGALADGSQAVREKASPHVPGRLIVKFRDDVMGVLPELQSGGETPDALQGGLAVIQALNDRFGLVRLEPLYADLFATGRRASETMTLNSALFPLRADRGPASAEIPALEQVYVLEFPADVDLEALARAYEAQPSVLYAQPDYIYQVSWTEPDDPYWSTSGSWGQGFRDLYGLRKIKTPLAWDITRGAGAVVAVIDTGVDRTHEDLAGKIWTNPGEIPGNNRDDDGNGFRDDVWGWNFSANTNDPTDRHGHGTHVAGTIAAATDNGIGVAGILWEGKVMAVQGLNASGSGTTAGLARAIKYAVDMGADVLSMSWGMRFYDKNRYDATLKEALDYADAAGCVLVASAGNDNGDGRYNYPANHPKVISVAAIDYQGHRASFSNFGPTVDVAAPGVDILSLRAQGTDMYRNGTHIVGEKYYYASGTSMACPHVSGVAGLILSVYPYLSNEEVRRIIRGTATSIQNEERFIGTGIVNAWQALEVDPSIRMEARITYPAEDVFVNDNPVEVRGTVYGGGEWRLEYNTDYYAGQGWQLIASGYSPIEEGLLADWDVSGIPDGRYILRLSVPFDNSYGSPTLEEYRAFTLDRDIKAGWAGNPPVGGSLATTPLVADVDGDGMDEIFVAGYTGIACLYEHDGSLAPGWPIDTGEDMRDTEPAAADLDGDGNLEIVWATKGTIEAYHHDGRAVSGWPKTEAPDWGSAGWPSSHVALADLTGDGDIEVITGWWTRVGDQEYRSQVVIYNGDGTIDSRWLIGGDGYHGSLGYLGGGFAVGDVDGDGRSEIALSIWGQNHFLFRHDGTPYPGWPRPWNEASNGSEMAPVLGDFDGDGEIEVFFGENTTLYGYERDGTLMPGWPFDTEVSTFAPVAWGDLDGDHDLEVVVGPGFGRNELLALHHDGSIVDGWPARIDGKRFTLGGSDSSSAIGDIDHDGEPEVVIVSPFMEPQRVYAFEADGTPLAGWPKTLNEANYSTKTSPTIADIDHDGVSEVIVASRAGDPLVWEVPRIGNASGRIWWSTEGHNLRRTNAIAGATTGFRVSPSSLAFEVNVGDGDPDPQWISLEGSGSSWNATETTAWLTLSKTRGGMPDRVEVRVEAAGLGAGLYSGTITFQSGNTVRRVSVTLEVIEPNDAPSVPSVEGPATAYVGSPVSFRAISADPEGDSIEYAFDWGDGEATSTGPMGSGLWVEMTHTYGTPGEYGVTVQAVDVKGSASPWSAPSVITIVEEQETVDLVTARRANTYSYFGRSSHYTQQAQSFKAEGEVICRVSVALARYGRPTEDITVHLRSNVRGSDLATAIVPAEAVTSSSYVSPTWVEAVLPGCVTVTPGATYYLVLTSPVMSSWNYYRLPLNRNNPYLDGSWYKGTAAQRQGSYDMLVRIAFSGGGFNTPPNRANVEDGPGSGIVGMSYTYTARASDPDGDRILYVFNWGDGETSRTGLVGSNRAASSSHAWQRAGVFPVRVLAEDEYGAQGPWSEVVEVRIDERGGGENRPPASPTLPQGPPTGVVGEPLTFSTAAADPDGDTVSLILDWGDGTQGESGLVPSGRTVSLSHVWETPGTYRVRAKAVDDRGAASVWSEATTVEIHSPSGTELIVSQNPTGTWYLGSSTARRRQAQTFKSIGSTITGVSLALVRVGEPTGSIEVTIRRSLASAPLASAVVDPSEVASIDPDDPSWVRVSFPSPAPVKEGYGYYLVLEVNQPEAVNHYRVGYDVGNPYPFGMWYLDTTARRNLDMTCTIVFGQ